jgi:hypothetical protein
MPASTSPASGVIKIASVSQCIRSYRSWNGCFARIKGCNHLKHIYCNHWADVRASIRRLEFAVYSMCDCGAGVFMQCVTG